MAQSQIPPEHSRDRAIDAALLRLQRDQERAARATVALARRGDKNAALTILERFAALDRNTPRSWKKSAGDFPYCYVSYLAECFRAILDEEKPKEPKEALNLHRDEGGRPTEHDELALAALYYYLKRQDRSFRRASVIGYMATEIGASESTISNAIRSASALENYAQIEGPPEEGMADIPEIETLKALAKPYLRHYGAILRQLRDFG